MPIRKIISRSITDGTIENDDIKNTTIASGKLVSGIGGGFYQGENGSTSAAANKGDIFRINENTLNTTTVIDVSDNASATGPLTIATNTTLTINGVLAII